MRYVLIVVLGLILWASPAYADVWTYIRGYDIYSGGGHGGMLPSYDARYPENIYTLKSDSVIVDTTQNIEARGGYTYVLPADALDVSLGYTVTLNMRLETEGHTSDQRGSPSLIINAWSEDGGFQTLYLAFQHTKFLTNNVTKIFSYRVNSQGQFEIDTTEMRNTAQSGTTMVEYTIVVNPQCHAIGSGLFDCWDYELYHSISPSRLIKGTLKDFSPYAGSGARQALAWPGMIWIGDDTGRAHSTFELKYLSIDAMTPAKVFVPVVNR